MDRESCYGGVFMESIVTFQNARSATRAPSSRSDPGHEFHECPQDLLYPCTALSEKYLRSCYLMQTSAVLTFLNYDFAQAFTQCERVTGDHQTTCFRSLGGDISGFTLRDPQRVTELCGLGKATRCGSASSGQSKTLFSPMRVRTRASHFAGILRWPIQTRLLQHVGRNGGHAV